jgi:hypothetical protein
MRQGCQLSDDAIDLGLIDGSSPRANIDQLDSPNGGVGNEGVALVFEREILVEPSPTFSTGVKK